MRLVWKLLRQHISVPQFAGFFFANLVGMLIVLLGFQFYHDVLPVFTAKDSFLKADYLILSKRVGTADVFTGRGHEFSGSEIDDLSAQPFVTDVGKFTSTNYRVDASLSVNGIPLMKTDFFFESVLSWMSPRRSGNTSLVTNGCPSSCPVPILICIISVSRRPAPCLRLARDC